MLLSPNGRYVLRLYFNGCWRRVEIDDHLPSSKTNRVLHVIDRRHPRLLWPALVEKAYLKIRGGYDFPGSNSGTDLAILTGWIPQQVFLHDHDVEPDRLWEEVVRGFAQGHVLITIGTGKLPKRQQRQLGLAAEHDYAVLEISSDDNKEMLIKNPWADGDVWKGAARRRANPSGEQEDDAEGDEAMMPGTFWMDFNSVFQYFENMYLNWSPGLFCHREDFHFTWTQDSAIAADNLIIDNPQFAITATKTGEVWLLLHRHFRTGDYSEATINKNGYISLYLYARDGQRMLTHEGATIRGPFVDSPNTLLRFQGVAGKTYTAVVISQDLPSGKLNFSISAFAHCTMTLKRAQIEYPQVCSLTSAWTRTNAGGNSGSSTYFSNPQFQVQLERSQRIALVLRITHMAASDTADDQTVKQSDVDVNVKIVAVSSNGSRVHRLRLHDVLAHSGDYRRGSAVLETELGPGTFTAICSTFEPKQYTDFCLDLHYCSSTTSQPLSQLPAEHAGRLCIHSSPAVFSHGTDRLLAPLSVPRLSRASFIVRQDTFDSSMTDKAQSSLFKLTLEQGQGPYKTIKAGSEGDDSSFSSISSGIRIDDVDLQPEMFGPAMGGLWLVLERLPSQESSASSQQLPGSGSREVVLKVDMYTDERIELGAWGRGEG